MSLSDEEINELERLGRSAPSDFRASVFRLQESVFAIVRSSQDGEGRARKAAEFAVKAVNALPDLIAEVRRMRAMELRFKGAPKRLARAVWGSDHVSARDVGDAIDGGLFADDIFGEGGAL